MRNKYSAPCNNSMVQTVFRITFGYEMQEKHFSSVHNFTKQMDTFQKNLG